jgi:hypothetical protein
VARLRQGQRWKPAELQCESVRGTYIRLPTRYYLGTKWEHALLGWVPQKQNGYWKQLKWPWLRTEIITTRIDGAWRRDTGKMENMCIHKGTRLNNNLSGMTPDRIVRTERDNSLAGRSVGKQRERWDSHFGGNKLMAWKKRTNILEAISIWLFYEGG